MTVPPRAGIGVVGAGTLGTTVVRAVLAAGSAVTVVARGGPDRCREHAAGLAAGLHREVSRGRLSADAAGDMLGRLRVTPHLADLAAAGVVVESVPEDPSVKREVIAAIEDVVAPTAIVASTTSGIPAGVLARGARHPERVVVAHFVWPAHRIPLVEVAFSGHSSAAVRTGLLTFLDDLGKRPVVVADRPGFLITRALFAYWDAALELVAEGVPPAAVDAELTAFGWPLGPLTVLEATGLPSVARIYRDLEPHLPAPLPFLAGLAAAGVATGATRLHAADGSLDPRLGAALGVPARAPAGPQAVVDRAVGALAREVDRAVADGVVASWEEAGAAVDAAYGFPRERGGLARWWHTQSRRRPEAPAGDVHELQGVRS